MDIGIRQLRNSLSEQLALVQEGHTVTITSHGKPVARIVPIDQPTKLEQLIASGRVVPPRRPKSPARTPIDAGGSVLDFLDEQRR